MDSRGLVHTDAVFEPFPIGYPLETFRVKQDGNGDGYLSLYTDDYGFDGDIVTIFVEIESSDGVNPDTGLRYEAY